MVTPTFENLYGFIWWQPCWKATIFQYNTTENVKNSLANNTDQNALKFDREENRLWINSGIRQSHGDGVAFLASPLTS